METHTNKNIISSRELYRTNVWSSVTDCARVGGDLIYMTNQELIDQLRNYPKNEKVSIGFRPPTAKATEAFEIDNVFKDGRGIIVDAIVPSGTTLRRIKNK